MFFQSILALFTVKLFNFIVCVFVFLKSSQWIMKWWYHWKPFYPGFTWYVGPTSHKSSGAVIWLVGVGPTHLPRLSLQSHVTWDPRPTSSRVGPTSHESSGAVIWLVGVGPTHHHTSHESFDVVTWRVGPTHRPTRAGGSLYNWEVVVHNNIERWGTRRMYKK